MVVCPLVFQYTNSEYSTAPPEDEVIGGRAFVLNVEEIESTLSVLLRKKERGMSALSKSHLRMGK